MSSPQIAALEAVIVTLSDKLRELSSAIAAAPSKVLEFVIGDQVYPPTTIPGYYSDAAFYLKPVAVPEDFVAGEDLIVKINAPAGKSLIANLVPDGWTPSQLKLLLPFNKTGTGQVSLEGQTIQPDFGIIAEGLTGPLPPLHQNIGYVSADAFNYNLFLKGTETFGFTSLSFSVKALATGSFKFVDGTGNQLNVENLSPSVTKPAAVIS